MAPSFVLNGDLAGGTSVPAPNNTGRVASVYSEVQTSRIDHELPLLSVLKGSFQIVDGPLSSSAGNSEEIAKLFPCLIGQRSAMLVPSSASTVGSDEKLKIGVVSFLKKEEANFTDPSRKG